MEYCPRCGERVEPDDAYCFECGTELDGAADGAERGHERPGESERTRGRTPQGESERTRGRTPPGGAGADTRGAATDRRNRGRDPVTGNEPRSDGESGQVESLTTLWAAVALSVLAMLESAGTILTADEQVEQVESLLADEEVPGWLTSDLFVALGALGLVVALATAGLCYRYYRRGYVDRRFFWGVVGGGVGLLVLGGGISPLLLIGLGAYGLLVVTGR